MRNCRDHLVTCSKEPNIIRGGTPYLSHCDATYVAPPAGGNAVDVLSVDHSISYVVEEYSGNHCAFFVSRRMKDWAGCITKVPLTVYIIFLYICTVYKICEV